MAGVADLGAGSRLYLDTNIWIYAVEGIEPHAPRLAALFSRVDSGAMAVLTSELSLLEALVKPIQDGKPDLALAYETALSPSPGVGIVPVSRAILVEAAKLRATRALRTPDAVHLATASVQEADAILTNDARWRGIPGVPPVYLVSELALDGSSPPS